MYQHELQFRRIVHKDDIISIEKMLKDRYNIDLDKTKIYGHDIEYVEIVVFENNSAKVFKPRYIPEKAMLYVTPLEIFEEELDEFFSFVIYIRSST